VELDGAYNVRDLGGLRVVDDGRIPAGLIYRGDSLDQLSPRDENLLFDQLNIRAIIDLRTKAEISRPAAWEHDGVAYHHHSLIDDNRIGREPFPSDNPQELAKVYLNNIKDGRDAIADIFMLLYDYIVRGIPLIYHCAAGRDRTGVITALLLSLARVRESDIADDYVQSNRHALHVTERLESNPLYANQHSHQGVVLLKAETILRFLELLRIEFGGVEQFLLTCGIPRQVLEELRDSLHP
jgi:protein tyrosine/serine phosphatase